MKSAEIVKQLVAKGCYCTDRDGNIACHYCGAYRDHLSRDGAVAAGTHRPTCVYLAAQSLVNAT